MLVRGVIQKNLPTVTIENNKNREKNKIVPKNIWSNFHLCFEGFYLLFCFSSFSLSPFPSLTL
jgi:hypothetical protein